MEASVDDLHPGVTKRGGDDFGAAVMPVETGLGDEDSDGAWHPLNLGGGTGVGNYRDGMIAVQFATDSMR